MTERQQIPKKLLKLELILAFVQLLFALLFTVVVYVFIDSFGGEFLVLAENSWILIIFAIFLVGGTICSTILAFMTLRKEVVIGYLSEKIKNKNAKTAWLLFWAIWNIICGIIIIVIFGILYLWVADAISIDLIIILSIPFIGQGILLIAGGIRVIIEKLKSLKDVRIMRGLTASAFSFLFLISSFGITISLWNPQWTAGVEHQVLFGAGMEGRGYRIPSMLVIQNDTGHDIILAFCESRADAMLDWGDIDIVMRRSTDNGTTWGAITTIVDAGSRTAGNPCPVFDNLSKVIWLPYCIDNKRVYVMNSTDYGLTWSSPIEITAQLDLGLTCPDSPLCMEYGTGPGNGIQLSNGTLVIPAYYFEAKSTKGSHVIYSNNNGTTWHKGGNLGIGGESQVLQHFNGSIAINCRYKRGTYRYMGWSNDGGVSWFTKYLETDLPAAGCQGSMMRFTDINSYNKNRVLFSHPNYNSRGHMTLWMSYDEGLTWNISRELYSGPSAYSQIGVLSDGTILLLFETGKFDYRESITLAKVDLDWLSSGNDILVPN